MVLYFFAMCIFAAINFVLYLFATFMEILRFAKPRTSSCLTYVKESKTSFAIHAVAIKVLKVKGSPCRAPLRAVFPPREAARAPRWSCWCVSMAVSRRWCVTWRRGPFVHDPFSSPPVHPRYPQRRPHPRFAEMVNPAPAACLEKGQKVEAWLNKLIGQLCDRH